MTRTYSNAEMREMIKLGYWMIPADSSGNPEYYTGFIYYNAEHTQPIRYTVQKGGTNVSANDSLSYDHYIIHKDSPVKYELAWDKNASAWGA